VLNCTEDPLYTVSEMRRPDAMMSDIFRRGRPLPLQFLSGRAQVRQGDAGGRLGLVRPAPQV